MASEVPHSLFSHIIYCIISSQYTFVTPFGGPELLYPPSDPPNECSLTPNFYLLPLFSFGPSCAFSVSGTSKHSYFMFSFHKAVRKDAYNLLYKLEVWLFCWYFISSRKPNALTLLNYIYCKMLIPPPSISSCLQIRNKYTELLNINPRSANSLFVCNRQKTGWIGI